MHRGILFLLRRVRCWEKQIFNMIPLDTIGEISGYLKNIIGANMSMSVRNCHLKTNFLRTIISMVECTTACSSKLKLLLYALSYYSRRVLSHRHDPPNVLLLPAMCCITARHVSYYCPPFVILLPAMCCITARHVLHYYPPCVILLPAMRYITARHALY